MARIIISLLLALSISPLAFAQEAQNGPPSKTIDLRNPAKSNISNETEFDFMKGNPKLRNTIPLVRECATVEVEEERSHQHADEKESKESFEDWLQQSMRKSQRTRSTRRLRGNVYTLPVVVHVIYSSPEENISEEQVLSQIRVLNQDYRRTNADKDKTPRSFKDVAVDTGIEFCLASVDPNGQPTNGINRVSMDGSPFSERTLNEVVKPSTVWDASRYMNIWVCNISGGILGFAQFPSSSGLSGIPLGSTASRTDGIVCNYNAFGTIGTAVAPFNKGRTMTHEVGHWLGLRHIWGDGPCDEDDFCA
ncbi:MAG: zinc metalloprotease, partial [Bacteroidota bacterium]